MKPIPWQSLALALRRSRATHDPEALAELDAFVASMPRPRTYAEDRAGWEAWIADFRSRHGAKPGLPSPPPDAPIPPPPTSEPREPGEDDEP